MLKNLPTKISTQPLLFKLKEAASENEKMVYAMLETSEEGLSENTVKTVWKFTVKTKLPLKKHPHG